MVVKQNEAPTSFLLFSYTTIYPSSPKQKPHECGVYCSQQNDG